MLNGKKIFISSCAGLGDLLMFTPALRAIKAQYPACTVTFLTNEPNKTALNKLPYIDNVVTIKRKKAFGRIQVLPAIRQQDYVIFTDWQPQLALLSYLCDVPVRVGIPKKDHFFNRFLNHVLTLNVMTSSLYAAETNAQIFSEALGISITGDMSQPDISLPDDKDICEAHNLLETVGLSPKKVFICMAPFTGMEQRDWPVEYVQQFVRLVNNELNMPVVLLGPAHKMNEAATIQGAKCLVGMTNIMQMVEIINRSKLYVGPDSGPMHIACAVRTPSVALFNKDLPSRWAPRHNCRVITLGLSCSPCSDETARQCESLECMRRITPDMVFAATCDELTRLI